MVALIVCGPIVEGGIVKLAVNPPAGASCHFSRTCRHRIIVNVMMTSELGSKSMPIIFTRVPTGPKVLLSPMTGFYQKTSL